MNRNYEIINRGISRDVQARNINKKLTVPTGKKVKPRGIAKGRFQFKKIEKSEDITSPRAASTSPLAKKQVRSLSLGKQSPRAASASPLAKKQVRSLSLGKQTPRAASTSPLAKPKTKKIGKQSPTLSSRYSDTPIPQFPYAQRHRSSSSNSSSSISPRTPKTSYKSPRTPYKLPDLPFKTPKKLGKIEPKKPQKKKQEKKPYNHSQLPKQILSFSNSASAAGGAGGASKSAKTTKYKSSGGGDTKSYTYDDIIKVWHLFDTKHDFGVKYNITSPNKINNIQTSESIKNLYKDFVEKSLQESSIANELLLYARNKRDNKIKNNLFNLKIYYKKNASDMFELKKKAFIIHKDVPKTVGQFLFKNKSKNNCFYLQDIHINNISSTAWQSFELNILKAVSNKVVPFEKLWDPLISKVPADTSDDYPCKHSAKTLDRVNAIYNRIAQTQDIENELAFRNLTKEYLNISFECANNVYKGITFILMKSNGSDADTIRTQYANLISYINSKDIEFNVFNKNNKICITANINGFNIENIKETIKYMENKGLLIHSNLTNKEYLKQYNKYDSIKTLILFFICHIYLKKLEPDVVKAILYDLKKSGDWGQALYCKYMNIQDKNTTTCFVSGDMLSAFYSVLQDTPTIIGSSRPKNEEEEYNQLQIYTGDKEFSFAYIENVIVSYMKNELLYTLKQYKDMHQSMQDYIGQIEAQWDNYISQLSNFLQPSNFQQISKDNITFEQYPKMFFDLIVKSKEIAYREPSQDVIKQILVQFIELYNHIWEFFKSIKPNERLGDYIDNFGAMIIKYYDNEREKIFKSTQSAFSGINVTDKIAVQKACYDGMNVFKDALNYCSDILYIVYVFIIHENVDDPMDIEGEKTQNKDIYHVINQFAKNMLYYLTTTKAFIKQNPDIKMGRSPFNLRDMLPELNNPHSSLLRDILQKDSQSRNVNNAREKALQEFQNIYSYYEMMLYDIQDLIGSIQYDIIDKVRVITTDTPIYKFRELFNNIIIPKINRALTFNILEEIDKICSKRMIPEADCNRIKETFPILANFNSIYNISQFIFIILEDLQNHTYEELRPHLEETAQEHGETKIQTQIQTFNSQITVIINEMKKQYAYDGKENLNDFITNKIKELKEAIDNGRKAKIPKTQTAKTQQFKEQIKALNQEQKKLKKIENKLIALYQNNSKNKDLQNLLNSIMDISQIKQLQKNAVPTNNDNISIRLPPHIAKIDDKINNIKNQIRTFQKFINIGYV
jgi:hypothetical protein